tara:strand:+ start:14810 stop:15253 length:444 start_codon:yes stop_codon:yes gene_type:complete
MAAGIAPNKDVTIIKGRFVLRELESIDRKFLLAFFDSSLKISFSFIAFNLAPATLGSLKRVNAAKKNIAIEHAKYKMLRVSKLDEKKYKAIRLTKNIKQSEIASNLTALGVSRKDLYTDLIILVIKRNAFAKTNIENNLGSVASEYK